MNTFNEALSKGIYAPYAKGFLPYSVNNNRIVVDYARAARNLRQLAQDSNLSTVANIGAPAALFTYIDPNIIEILYGAKNAGLFFNPTQVGNWTDDYANFPVEEKVGQVTPYNDYTGNTTTDVNYNFPARQNFRYQTTIQYGDLETEKAAEAQIQLATRKQNAAAYTISNAENAFYLYGVAGLQNYGLLNDPNLPTAISPISVNDNSTWEDKANADGDNVANIVYNDVNKLVAELTANNGGHISMNERMILGISNKMVAYLTNPNVYGKTAKELLVGNYPNLEIVQLPELSTDEGEKLVLVVPELNGEETAINGFSRKFGLSRLVADLSAFRQKASAGTYGCVIRRPSLIAIMNGI